MWKCEGWWDVCLFFSRHWDVSLEDEPSVPFSDSESCSVVYEVLVNVFVFFALGRIQWCKLRCWLQYLCIVNLGATKSRARLEVLLLSIYP